MNFFQNLNENLNDNDGLTIRITKTADGIVVSVLPDARVKNMAPINMEGTPAEVDEHFMATVTKGITIQKEFKSNLDELEAAATAEINAKKQKASAKAKPKAESSEDEGDDEEGTASAPKAEKAPKPVKEKKLPKGMDALLKRYTDSGSDDLMQKYCVSEITKALVKEKWEQAEIDALLAKHGPSAPKPELPADAPFMGGQAGIGAQSVQLDPETSNAIAELNLEQEQTEQAIADEAVNDLTPKEEEEDGLLF